MPEAKPALPEVQKWLDHFSAYDRTFKKWEARVEKILQRYRDERTDSARKNSAQFNVLWSNVQTLSAATFARVPKPDVSRRFRDNDPVGRVASLIIERGLDYEIQHYPDYRSTLKADILDRFLGGRGTAWQRYEPHMRAQGTSTPVNGVEVTEDVDEPGEELDYECAPVDYVHWRDFGHVIGRTWEEVPAVWRWVYLRRSACIERFGEEKGSKIPLDATPEEIRRQQASQTGDKESLAKIAEIWDKEKKEAYWLSPSLGEILDTRKQGTEPGDLPAYDGFFPCPKPLYSTLTNESLVPVPDWTLYQDQGRTLDTVTDRMVGMIDSIKVQGVYDSAQKVLARLFTEGENAGLIPADNWHAFAEKNGLKGCMDIVDLDPFGRALKELYLAFAQIKGQVDELTGISDIIRGETDAGETATAQQIKSQYATLRLKEYQTEVALFATSLLRLKAQVMCQKFSDDTLLKIAAVDQLSPEDQQRVPEALALLRSDALRSFRVEVAADSLIQIDEQAEKEAAGEFLAAVAKYVVNIAEAVKGMDPRYASVLVPMFMDLMKFGVTRFKVGRTVEAAIDRAADQLKALAQEPPPPPPPDPKVQAEQMKAQAEVQKAQMSVQVEQEKAGIARQKMQDEYAMDQMQMGMEAQQHQQEFAHSQQMADQQFQNDRRQAALKVQTAKAMPKQGARPQ